MAVLEDFEEISLFGFGELRKAPVIQDKQLDARERLEKPGMASIATGQRQRFERPMPRL